MKQSQVNNDIFLTFFNAGNFSKAPGTIGTMFGVTFWFFATFLLNYQTSASILLQGVLWFILVILMLALAIKKIEHYSKKIRNVSNVDNQAIVIDEVIGVIISLQITYLTIADIYFSNSKIIALHIVFNFALFRFFDIVKPWIIGRIDRDLKTPFGVVLDDMISGIFSAALISIVTISFTNHLIFI